MPVRICTGFAIALLVSIGIIAPARAAIDLTLISNPAVTLTGDGYISGVGDSGDYSFTISGGSEPPLTLTPLNSTPSYFERQFLFPGGNSYSFSIEAFSPGGLIVGVEGGGFVPFGGSPEGLPFSNGFVVGPACSETPDICGGFVSPTPIPPALPMFGAALLALAGFAAWSRRASRG